jgi:hypothetical protein
MGFKISMTKSAYFVLPTELLCAAPEEWQARFIGLVEELHEMFPDRFGYQYEVKQKRGPKT